MKQSTHQKIVKALSQMLADLARHLQQQGVSEAEVLEKFNAIIDEGGMYANDLIESSSRFVHVSGVVPTPAQVGSALANFQSGRYVASLLESPEPTSNELSVLLSGIRNALPNLRRHYLKSSDGLPSPRVGGRPRKLATATEQREIRDAIRAQYSPERKLKEAFENVAVANKVSATTIKRIWYKQEKMPVK